LTRTNRWSGWCSELCSVLSGNSSFCNPVYNWMIFENIINSSNLCLTWSLVNFSFNVVKLRWSWMCVSSGSNVSQNCFANKSICWDGYIGRNEKCENCSKDLKDDCIDDWNDSSDCKCEECPENLKADCVQPVNPGWDDNPDCKCEECPENLKADCVQPVSPGWDDNPDCGCDECPEKLGADCIKLVNPGWDDNPDCGCDECPEKLGADCIKLVNPGWDDNPNGPNNPKGDDNPNGPDNPDEDDVWEIENADCNSCPCEYVDFSTDLARWDSLRAKLWDKVLSEVYRYSNSVSLESFLDLR